MADYKVHMKSKKHKRLEEKFGILPVGADAYCRSFRMSQNLTDEPEKVTCSRCLAKMQAVKA